jgi:hypothetical protein
MTKSGSSLTSRLSATLFWLFVVIKSDASMVAKDADTKLSSSRNEPILNKPAIFGFKQNNSVLSEILSTNEQTFSPMKVSRTTTVCCAMVLASTAGLMNGACLAGLVSGAKQATTAVTGAVTNSAIGIPSGNIAQFTAGTKCLLSYMGGSAIAGLLVPRPVPFELRNPLNVAFAFTCAAGLLVTSSIKAHDGAASYLWYSLAASGIQNSLTSTFTANLCRTSHFSGTTSDIGTYIGQLLRGNLDSLPRLKVLCLLFASFWAGGFLSVPLGEVFSHNTFLIAAGVYVSLASTILFSSPAMNKKHQKLA